MLRGHRVYAILKSCGRSWDKLVEFIRYFCIYVVVLNRLYMVQ